MSVIVYCSLEYILRKVLVSNPLTQDVLDDSLTLTFNSLLKNKLLAFSITLIIYLFFAPRSYIQLSICYVLLYYHDNTSAFYTLQIF